MRLRAAVPLVLVALAPPSRAEEQDRVARARAHYEAGRALHSLGNYRDALREFASGYELDPRPGFLLNMGQTYRRLEQLDEARTMFRRFLDATPAEDPEHVEVVGILAELERADRAAAHPATAATSVAPARAPPTENHPSRLRWWWIVPVVAVVLAGAAIGIYFAARPSELGCGDVALGCVPAPPRQ
jgi:tetratricopeptide (TPR) repeat protein